MARLRSLFIFISLLIISPSPSLSADDSTAPYIYYYANTANAIVVERADGSDSRLIATGAMPPEHSVISDLDWSPSGEWMAWRSSTYNGPGAPAFKGWIARSDGSQRLTLLDGVGFILALKWSPIDDLLYVAYAAPGALLKLIIIDPHANTIIAQTQYQYEFIGTWYEGLPTAWLEDDSGIYFTLYFDATTLLGQLSITNQTSNRVFSTSWNTDPFLVNSFKGRLLSYESFSEGVRQQVRLTMRDLSTQKSIFIDSQSLEAFNQNHPRFQVYWNSTMTHALILEWTCEVTAVSCSYPDLPRTRLYLLDWEAGTLQFMAARVSVSDYDDRPGIDQHASYFWSPNGRYALIGDELNHFIIVDVTSGELFPSINLPSVGGWHWAEQSNALIFYSSLGRRFHRYDLKQKRLSSLDIAIPLYGWFSVSPDGRFVGIINRYSGVDAPDMFDLRTQGKRRWPRHSLGSSAGPILRYLWHPGSRWFMTSEWSNLAGGPGPSAVTILNTAGDVRRELSVCSGLGSCTGFVPDRAVAHLGEGSPQSVIPQPLLSLPHDGRVVAVAWNSDGDKIASYSLTPESTSGRLNVWNVSGKPTLLLSHHSDLNVGYLVQGGKLTWDTDGTILSMVNPSEFKQYFWSGDTGELLETRSTIDQPVQSDDSSSYFTQKDLNLRYWDGQEMRTLVMPYR
jgi:hypothetical protein